MIDICMIYACKHLKLISSITRHKNMNKKKGIFSGRYAIHPLTDERVPIWFGNFVIATYGTGAVMAVPAHDERDFDFATKYDIPIQRVLVMEEGGDAAVAVQIGGPHDHQRPLLGALHDRIDLLIHDLVDRRRRHHRQIEPGEGGNKGGQRHHARWVRGQEHAGHRGDHQQHHHAGLGQRQIVTPVGRAGAVALLT